MSHLADVHENYFQQLWSALGSAWWLLVTAGACTLHAVLPFILVTTTSRRVAVLAEKLDGRATYKEGRPLTTQRLC